MLRTGLKLCLGMVFGAALLLSTSCGPLDDLGIENFGIEIVGEAEAQQITPVRQSKLPAKIVFSSVSSAVDATSTVIFDTTGFAAVQYYFSGETGCASTQATWEVSNLPPFIKTAYEGLGGTNAKVRVLGAPTALGTYSRLRSTAEGFVHLVDNSVACTFTLYATMVPWPTTTAVQGVYNETLSMAYTGTDQLNPVLVGGRYDDGVDIRPRTLNVSQFGALQVTERNPALASDAASPVNIASAAATTVFTFTRAYSSLTASNVSTVDLYCKAGLAAAASITDYQFVLNAAPAANRRGDTITLPQHYSTGHVFSCRAASGTGSLAFAPTP